jgi:SMI1 / KNR4 family (SUKH-1)
MFYAVSEMFNNSKDWLPFGEDHGDYIFCICLKRDKYGHIYLMRTDEIEEEDAFIFVCESFNEFINGLSVS